jgi:hypothetical protein
MVVCRVLLLLLLLLLRLERGDAFTFATPQERNTARRQTPN